jgi:cardiolipin synthase
MFAVVTASALWMLWARTHRRGVRFSIASERSITNLTRAIAGVTWGHVVEGNRVEIVQNAVFFDRLIADVEAARSSIHLETFLWHNGEVSDRVVTALRAAASRMVEVRVLVDQRGSNTTSPDTWANLRQAGVDFRVYHRSRLRELAFINQRDHRKIAVIDGRIGYTFGHGMADMWSGKGWRDTAARIPGPVVNVLQSAFFENWSKVTREVIVGEHFFPLLEPAGTIPIHVACISPPETASAVQRLYYVAISLAKRELILQNPYFIPDEQAIALCRAALARGVAVSIMLPTSGTSDFPIVQHASHYYYGELLAAGARIWEFQQSGLHQKVMIVDGEWCSLGSTNFDPRSFHINDEITVAIGDRAIAGELRLAFFDDVKRAREWTLAEWNARSPWHRTVDALSAMLRHQL